MEENQNKTLFGLSIEQETATILKTASSWARILAIGGFIFGAMMILVGIVMKINISSLEGDEVSDPSMSGVLSMGGTIAMMIYFVMGILLFVSSVFVLRFANKSVAALKTNDIQALNAAFAGIRNHFSLWAIVLILMLLLIVLVFVGFAMRG